MNGMFYGCSKLEYINMLNFKNFPLLSSPIINLFDQAIPPYGKIIANENLITKLNKAYIKEWNIIIS